MSLNLECDICGNKLHHDDDVYVFREFLAGFQEAVELNFKTDGGPPIEDWHVCSVCWRAMTEQADKLRSVKKGL